MARKKKRFWTRVKEFFVGKKEEFKKLPTKTKKELETVDNALKFLDKKIAAEEKAIARGMKDIPVEDQPSMDEMMPGGFPEIEQPKFRELPDIDVEGMRAKAERKFATEDVPALAQRFSSGFTPGGKGTGSGFGASLGRARADLTSNLAALSEKLVSDYNLQRGRVETDQQRVGLAGQIAGADTQFKGGKFRSGQYEQGLRRSDLLSNIQYKQRPDIGALTGVTRSPSFENVFRPATGGVVGSSIDIAKELAVAYLSGGKK